MRYVIERDGTRHIPSDQEIVLAAAEEPQAPPAHRYIYKPRTYAIDYVLPEAGAPHVICGGAGSGKTTLLFQMLEAMRQGQPFLDYATHPRPFVYVHLDRTEAETVDTLVRMGINPETFPMVRQKIELPDSNKPDVRINALFARVEREWPGAKVIAIDGFAFLTPHGRINDYLVVGEFLQRVATISEQKGLTVIALMHSPKAREGQGIKDPRQQILGSVGAGGVAGNIIVLEQISAAQEDSKRRLTILPRNGKMRVETMDFDMNGRLVLDEVEAADRAFFFEQRIAEFDAGANVPMPTMRAIAEQVHLSKASMYRKIGELCELGVLVKSSGGRGGKEAKYHRSALAPRESLPVVTYSEGELVSVGSVGDSSTR